MATLLEIVAGMIAWVTGAKIVESFDKKDRKKAYLSGIVFLLVVFGMGAYSIYWLASKLIGH